MYKNPWEAAFQMDHHVLDAQKRIVKQQEKKFTHEKSS